MDWEHGERLLFLTRESNSVNLKHIKSQRTCSYYFLTVSVSIHVIKFATEIVSSVFIMNFHPQPFFATSTSTVPKAPELAFQFPTLTM